ncbi:hypothetical protein JCM11641_004916 [Rhodosporidiobolus odoratus]
MSMIAVTSERPTKRPASPPEGSPPCKRREDDQSSPTTSTSQIFRWLTPIDLDHTLIRPLQGQRFYHDALDWEWWTPSRPDKDRTKEEDEDMVINRLKQLHAQGYAIVVFTSQRLDKTEWWSAYKKRLAIVANKLDVPARYFTSTDYDIYRKPVHGAWLAFVNKYNGGRSVDLSRSFFVGDAGGFGTSELDWDRKFAHNIDMPYLSPRQFFLKDEPSSKWSYKGWVSSRVNQSVPLYTPTNTPLIPRPLGEFDPPVLDIVVLLGAPGAGKTSFAQKHFRAAGYVYTNLQQSSRDPISAVQKALSRKPPPSLVIDAPINKAEARQTLIKTIRQASPSHRVRLLFFTAPEMLAKHNNVVSTLFDQTQAQKEGRERAFTTEIDYRRYYADFSPPTIAEGWDEIKHINFKFDASGEDGPQRLKQWRLFLNCYPRDSTKK